MVEVMMCEMVSFIAGDNALALGCPGRERAWSGKARSLEVKELSCSISAQVPNGRSLKRYSERSHGYAPTKVPGIVFHASTLVHKSLSYQIATACLLKTT
ncbi:hypothetical protein EK904_009129 [Melospiza melodia maxima]|nr:hypothetical protein EK904_009129 [Melospiza melodia maxima]